MSQKACPSDAVLTSFNEGRVNDDTLESVAAHVLTCLDCQQSLETLTDKASARKSAQGQRPANEASLNSEVCRAAIARVAEMQVEPSHPVESHPASVATKPPEFIGNCKILGPVGKGGMGVVYRALHTGLDKVVAVKVLAHHITHKESAVQRFKQEMKAIGRLQHPNIITAIDAGEVNGMHYLVMEFLEGLDLTDLSERCGQLDVPDACELIRQAALGLEHAWRRGLVHRDIKPSNLMLTVDDEGRPCVKILDLGLARLGELSQTGFTNRSSADLTSSGQIMGTADYMAPEQALDSHQVDVRADVYSLGATLCKLLTNTTPFPRAADIGIARQLAMLAYESVPSMATRRPDLPVELIQIVDAMLARSPEQRPASPGEVAQRLAPFANGQRLTKLLSPESADFRQRPLERQPAEFNQPSTPDLATSSTHIKSARLSEGDGSAASLAASSGSGTLLLDSTPRSQHALAPQTTGATRRRVLPWLIAAALLVSTWAAWQTFYIQTKHGMVVVEIKDPQLTVILGTHTFSVEQNGRKIQFTPGEHALRIKYGDLLFESDKFTLTDGKTETFRVKLLSGKVELARGDRVFGSWPVANTASVAAESKTPEGQGQDPNLQLARLLTMHGGTFNCTMKSTKDELYNISTLNEIPQTPFVITGVDLYSTTPELTRQVIDLAANRIPVESLMLNGERRPGRVTAASIRELARLTSLIAINVNNAPGLQAADFDVLGSLPHLESLNVGDMPIGDQILARIQNFPDLTALLLNDCQVTDQGLKILRNSKIQRFYVNSGLVTDSACEVFAEMPQLNHLTLAHCRGFTGAGLAKLQGIPITRLVIESSGIKSESLGLLSGLGKLSVLVLRHNQLTDAALTHLSGLKLETLELDEPQLTPAAVQQLQKSLPHCQISSNFKIAETQPVSACHQVAEWLVEQGGVIEVITGDGNSHPQIRSRDAIPSAPFRIHNIQLSNATRPMVEQLVSMAADRVNIEQISIFNASQPVPGEVIEVVSRLSHLKMVTIHGAQLTREHMAHLPKLTRLNFVSFDDCKFTPDALCDLPQLRHVVQFGLNASTLGDNGLEPIGEMTSIQDLYLNDAGMTDKMWSVVRHLSDLRKLELLNAAGLTGEGIEQLRELPLESITLRYTGFRNAAITTLVDFKSLKRLSLSRNGDDRAVLKDVALLTQLQELDLQESNVSNDELPELLSLPNLLSLSLAHTKVSDAGLEHVAKISTLQQLDLSGPEITDAGLVHLGKMKHLLHLNLLQTRVTSDGVKTLQSALPGCAIRWE